jgi:hypothetical protein
MTSLGERLGPVCDKQGPFCDSGAGAMVEEVYATSARCGTAQRSWKYRIEQHVSVLADRLARLGFVTTIVTTGPDHEGSEQPRNREAATGPDVVSSGRGDLNPGPPAPEADLDRGRIRLRVVHTRCSGRRRRISNRRIGHDRAGNSQQTLTTPPLPGVS